MGSASERLERAKAHGYERCSMSSIGMFINPEDGGTEEEAEAARKAANDYLSHFVNPAAYDLFCIGCEAKAVGGGLIGAFLSPVVWDLAWGATKCTRCGWPGRAHHVIRDADGEELLTVTNISLQIHPDEVSANEG